MSLPFSYAKAVANPENKKVENIQKPIENKDIIHNGNCRDKCFDCEIYLLKRYLSEQGYYFDTVQIYKKQQNESSGIDIDDEREDFISIGLSISDDDNYDIYAFFPGKKSFTKMIPNRRGDYIVDSDRYLIGEAIEYRDLKRRY